MIDFNNLKVNDVIVTKNWTTVYFDSPGDEWKDFPAAIGSEYSVSFYSDDSLVDVWIGPLVEIDEGLGICDIFDVNDFLTEEEVDELIKMAERELQK